MAFLYTKSISGDIFSHEIKCNSYSVGGSSEDWNVHYFVTPTGHLIYTHAQNNPNQEYALPFKMWSGSMVITRMAFKDAHIPTSNPFFYLDARRDLYYTIIQPNADGGTRKYNVLCIGEIDFSG
jgi:hypothetical protein